MPISSIQATIAKLSIRPPSATDPSLEAPCGVEEHVGPAFDSLSDVQAPPTEPPSSLSPPLTSPTHSPPPNGLDAPSSPPASPSVSPPPPPASSAPAPSSLELLAAMTPEAFSMEGGGKGKQRVTKQSFLQPAEGQGIHGTPRGEEGDDPLGSLDPLWSLGKP